MLPFQNGSDHSFRKDSTFGKVLDLYFFDRELRLLVNDIIERLEIAFKTQIIAHFSLENSAWWFENPNLYNSNFLYGKNISKIDGEIKRSGEVFINHYKSEYSAPQRPPSWMTVEILSMGLLSKIYRNLKMSKAKKTVSKHFKVPTPYILESWMHSLTFVRNICAHHGRLWNRTLTLKPQKLKTNHPLWLRNDNIQNGKIYLFLSCCLYLLKTINPENTFPEKFRKLIDKYPSVNLAAMGFHSDWKAEALWNSRPIFAKNVSPAL